MMNIINILVGGGILAFIEFLITRYDNKKDKNSEVLQAIERLDGKIDVLDQKIGAVEAKGDERGVIASRVRILRFADEMMEGRKHSHDSFQQVLSDIDEYEKYCDGHPFFRNNQTVETSKYIKRNYAERLERHDFL